MKILRFVFQKLTLEIFLNSNYGILQKIKLFYGTWSLESGLQNDHLKFIGQRYSKFNSFFLPVTIFIVSLNYFFFSFHQGGLSLPHSQNRKPIPRHYCKSSAKKNSNREIISDLIYIFIRQVLTIQWFHSLSCD